MGLSHISFAVLWKLFGILFRLAGFCLRFIVLLAYDNDILIVELCEHYVGRRYLLAGGNVWCYNMEKATVMEETHQKINSNNASMAVGSYVKIDSISIDLDNVNDKRDAGKCEHFSMR